MFANIIILYHVYIVKYLNTENIKMLGNTKMMENILMSEHFEMGAQGGTGIAWEALSD